MLKGNRANEQEQILYSSDNYTYSRYSRLRSSEQQRQLFKEQREKSC
jgi:hypothetical protein